MGRRGGVRRPPSPPSPHSLPGCSRGRAYSGPVGPSRRYLFPEAEANQLRGSLIAAARRAHESHERAAAVLACPARFSASQRSGAADGVGASPASTKLPHAVLLQTLLVYNLEARRARLEPFVAVYRAVLATSCAEEDGTAGTALSEAGFRELATALDPARTEEDLLRLLVKVDPYTHERIGLTECVAALAPDLNTLHELATAMAAAELDQATVLAQPQPPPPRPAAPDPLVEPLLEGLLRAGDPPPLPPALPAPAPAASSPAAPSWPAPLRAELEGRAPLGPGQEQAQGAVPSRPVSGALAPLEEEQEAQQQLPPKAKRQPSPSEAASRVIAPARVNSLSPLASEVRGVELGLRRAQQFP